MRTLAQSASNSSASTMASPVWVPWPISLFGITTSTLPSLPTFTQPFSAACPAAVGSGRAVFNRWRGGSMLQPTVSAPTAPTTPTAPSTKWRFFICAA